MTVLVDDASLLLDAAPVAAPPPTPAIRPLPTARGPISASVIDHLTGRASDDLPIDASSGPGGLAHDDDVHAALWLLNAATTSDFAGVSPERAASLRMRTLQWYLERAVEEQLRRRPRPSRPDDLRAHVRARVPAPLAPAARTPGAHALLVSRVEPALQPVVARVALAAAACPPVEAARAGADVPACQLAVANVGWLVARERRLRGAAIGHLCASELAAGRPAGVDELLRAVERSAPWLVADVAWGAEVTRDLADCADH
ncbi:MAG: hypothetical protein ACLGIC_04635 [Acidimicrobiia bacterium]